MKQDLYKITGNSRIACCSPSSILDCTIQKLHTFDQ